MLTNKMATVGDSSFSKSLIHLVRPSTVHPLDDVKIHVKGVVYAGVP